MEEIARQPFEQGLLLMLYATVFSYYISYMCPRFSWFCQVIPPLAL
jgi:hypothetical protein